MKTYTVELEVQIMAYSPGEAFEMVNHAVQRESSVTSVNSICEPYCDDDPTDFEFYGVKKEDRE